MGKTLNKETNREIRFLHGLGSCAISVNTDRSTLLRRYVAGAELRDDWTGLDRGQILQVANQMVENAVA